ncbi:MAG TPA: HAMP domain-containing sensor histidine kinase [Terriglobia bacterium]|nr:HAMP domain-containing sensor histidine kinase [Terriglobia bacterium]
MNEVEPTSVGLREAGGAPAGVLLPSPDGSGGPAPGSLNLLRAFEELQDLTERRSEALGAAVHQLKTPLAIVAGYIDLLLTEKAGPLTPRQRKIVEESQSNCTRLRKFIEDFLSFSAFETGRLVLHREANDLAACLAEVCGYWRPLFREKGVALRVSPGRAPLPRFPFDDGKIQHVTSNLLENALRCTPRGGSVTVSAEPYRWERRSLRQPGPGRERRRRPAPGPNAARVSVRDTGPGVAPEFRQEIFEDFVSLPQPGAQRPAGTGLGLAIARRLVAAHGGKIWVEGEPGQGSTFCFVLPLAAF